jgi:hypothetical protein
LMEFLNKPIEQSNDDDDECVACSG